MREIWAQREQDFQKAQRDASSSAYMPGGPGAPPAEPASAGASSLPTSLAQIPDLPDSPGSPGAPGAPGAPGSPQQSLPAPRVVVFGSAAVDITASAAASHAGSTSPGGVALTAGGVGRNLARAAQALLPAGAVRLVSPVGSDALAGVLRAELADGALRTDGLLPRAGRTASCVLFLSAGELSHGVADMGIVETLSAADIAAALPPMPAPAAPGAAPAPAPAPLVVFDLNLAPDAVAALLRECAARGLATFCDPTSVAKTPRLLPGLLAGLAAAGAGGAGGVLGHLAPNVAELDALHAALEPALDDTAAGEAAWAAVNALDLGAEFRAAAEARFAHAPWVARTGALRKLVGLSAFVDNVWLKAGSGGLVSLRFQARRDAHAHAVAHRVRRGRHSGTWLNIRHYPAPAVEGELNTTGAGDTLAGSLIASLSLAGEETESDDMVDAALRRVKATLESHHAVA